MTSKPASRRARATSLAPRSWPSSPGLATSTRTGIERCLLEDGRLLEFAPLLFEHVDHLPNRAVSLRACDEPRHQIVVVAPGRGRKLRQGPRNISGRTGSLD